VLTPVAGGANWVQGGYTTIVGAGIIANRYHIHNVTIENLTHDGAYQLELYHGNGDAPATSVRFSQLGGFFGNSVYYTCSAIIPAGERIRARLAFSNGGAFQATATISISYVEHP
jgi:hypothetical protein